MPPGDLRQALVALAADDPVCRRTAALLQYRFAAMPWSGLPGERRGVAGRARGRQPAAARADGDAGRPGAALDHAAARVGARGRVLPMARHAVGIEADVIDADPERPGEVVTVRGQHAVAVALGNVEAVRIEPADSAALPAGGHRGPATPTG